LFVWRREQKLERERGKNGDAGSCPRPDSGGEEKKKIELKPPSIWVGWGGGRKEGTRDLTASRAKKHGGEYWTGGLRESVTTATEVGGRGGRSRKWGRKLED